MTSGRHVARRAVSAYAGRLLMLSATLGPGVPCAADEAGQLPDPIVMMWQVTGEDPAADFRTLKSLGVNTVQSFSLALKPHGYVERYLRAAEDAGMAVIPYVGGRKFDAEVRCGLSEAGVEFIRRHRSSSAIVAWHSVDEPALRGISRQCQSRLYAGIKSLDPGRAVLLSLNFTSQAEYDDYFSEDSFDVLDLHKYVNWRVSKPQRELIRLFKANRKRSYPVIVTLRAFNSPGKFWRFDMDEGDLSAQYRFFFRDERISGNVGFYGWNLAPNVGIADIPALRTEFEQLMREVIRAAP